jgi:nitrogen fixation protein NifB
VGVKTLTVTVNAVDPLILAKICSAVILDGKNYSGPEGAGLLIEAQKRGIKKAAALGLVIKINIVLIPGINDTHIAAIAETMAGLGASIINIIPLIPQHEFTGWESPDCLALGRAREDAERFLPVFRHCQHCRADAIGIPGKGDISALLYGETDGETYGEDAPRARYARIEETFSHG